MGDVVNDVACGERVAERRGSLAAERRRTVEALVQAEQNVGENGELKAKKEKMYIIIK